MRLIRLFGLIAVMALLQGHAQAASVANIYYAATAIGAGDGTSCAAAYAYNDATNGFSIAGKWGTGSTQIGLDTIAHICGTITLPYNTTSFIFRGDGTAGHVITLKFETGAIVQSTVCPPDGGGTGAGACISMYNRNYIVLDGGTNGIIRNTDNGAALGHNQATSLVDGYLCSNCSIHHLTMANAVIKVSGQGAATPGDQIHSNTMSGSHWSFHDNVINDCGWCVFQLFGNGDTDTQIYSNTFTNFGHALMYATAAANATTNYYLHDNDFGAAANWTNYPTCDFHNDGLHTFTLGGSMNGVYIYNNYFHGDWGLCATGYVFIEAGGFSPSNASNVALFNNVGIVPTVGSEVNTNSWWGMFQCLGGTCLVANNTILGPNATDSTMCISMQHQTNLLYRNNVISPCGNPTEISNSTVTTANNNFYGPICQNGGNCFVYNGAFEGSFANWKSATGYDAAAVQSNTPMLNTNGTPQTGSPVIAAGANLTSLCSGTLTALCLDKNGVARPSSGAWTIGAYEVAGSSAPVVSLYTSSHDFGNQVTGTTSGIFTVTLTNIGNASLVMTSTALTTGTQYAIGTNTCTGTIAAAGACTTNLTFTPTTNGSKSDTLTYTDNAGTQTVTLTGTGTPAGAPGASLSISSYNFGNQTVSTGSSTLTITLTNTGTASLTMTSVALTTGTSYNILSNTCTGTIAAAATCTTGVRFIPASLGTKTDTLTFTNNATPSTQTVTFTGIGVAVPTPGCTANTTNVWTNIPVATQAGTFTTILDATPSQSMADAVISLSAVQVVLYGDVAAIVRFSDTGVIDAYNGTTATYTAANVIPYTGSLVYHFRIVTDVAAKTFSAYVTAPGGVETLLALNYGFRSQAAPLVNIATFSEIGTVNICNVSQNAVGGPTGPPPVSGLLSRFSLDDTFKVTTSGGKLNVRQTPSTAARVITTLANGSTGTITGPMGVLVANDVWWNVNSKGYVLGPYIRQ